MVHSATAAAEPAAEEPVPGPEHKLLGEEAASDYDGTALVGAVFGCFALFSARLWLPAVWEPQYVPVISPVYRQQEHWAAEPARVIAVMAHVSCGMLMLLAAVLQLDAPTRRGWPAVHRWVGRTYVAAGLGALASLRWLRSSSGAGSATQGDPLMAAFIDSSSMAWLAATACGIDAIARRRDAEAHARAMLLSAALSAQPILQRLLNALVLAPCAATLRCCYCAIAWGDPPWRARWGAPGGLLPLLVGDPATVISPSAPHHGSAGGGGASRAQLSAVHGPNARASPHVLSLDGYGEAEQAAFGLSAWLALLAVVGTAAVLSAAPSRRRRALGPDDTRLHAAKAAACWCDLGRRAAAYVRTARRVANRAAAVVTTAGGGDGVAEGADGGGVLHAARHAARRGAARVAAALALLVLVATPLALLGLLVSLWLVGFAAVATAWDFACASALTTPLYAAARLWPAGGGGTPQPVSPDAR